MAAIAYVNGGYRAMREAAVNIEDRGYQFGDGIYEVIYVHRGKPIDAALHFSRLNRSLAEIELSPAITAGALNVVVREVLRRNRVETGLVYIQVTRGVARRDHGFPPAGTRPSLIVTARHRPAPPHDITAWSASAICLPDERWSRCDIKSINLLPNVLARQKARLSGAYEAILYDAGQNVTEGAASSVWIIDRGGSLITRQLDRQVLPGCTRAALICMLESRQIRLTEAPFTLDALRSAREIFITSASSFIKPITRLDGAPVGDGKPGPVATQFFDLYRRHIEST